MIHSFRDPETERIWSGLRSRRLPSDIQAVALRKLRMINQARALSTCAFRRETGWSG